MDLYQVFEILHVAAVQIKCPEPAELGKKPAGVSSNDVLWQVLVQQGQHLDLVVVHVLRVLDAQNQGGKSALPIAVKLSLLLMSRMLH